MLLQLSPQQHFWKLVIISHLEGAYGFENVEIGRMINHTQFPAIWLRYEDDDIIVSSFLVS